MPSLYVIGYVTTGVLTLAFFVALYFLFERLASHHASTWQDLGSPEFFARPQPGTWRNVLRFFGRCEYFSLRDPLASALALSASVLFVLVLAISLYLQIVFYMHRSRWPAV
jgi:hypothetical protein